MKLETLNKKCKYCDENNLENLVHQKKRILPCCNEHYELYKQESIEKRKQTTLDKYGVENINQLDSIKNKKIQTNIEHLGVENPSQSNIVKEKKIQTSRKNWGVDFTSQSPIVKEKIIKTNIEKYGVDCVFKSPVIQEKIKKTLNINYGVDNPFQSSIIKEKSKQTLQKNFGVDYPMQSSIIQNKSIQTLQDNFGITNPFQSPIIQEKIKKTLNKKYGVDYPIQSPDILKKVEDTMEDRYGKRNAAQIEEFQEKIKITNNERYGTNYIVESEHFKQINLENLGVENPMHSEKIFNKVMKNFGKKHYKDTNLMYQTKPELKFIEKCKADNIEIENGDRISYLFNGKWHYYFCDFKIKDKETGKWQLIEIKQKHNWYYKDLKSGKLLAKAKYAIIFSVLNNYLPYKMIFS